jgi:hydrogenase maturation protein HypF
MSDVQQARIRVVGVVQGIGFRPFIYSQAIKRQLTGYVLNTGNSAVNIVVEGPQDNIIDFIESIEHEKPALAVIDSITTTWHAVTGAYREFTIRVSQDESQAGGSIIPADIAICEECLNDISNPESRHHNYPFTCCAICGPRYTTIVDTPYDRERTTMNEFPLCSDCSREYNDPHYRRYNAQTICCPKCGPSFRLLDKKGRIIETDNVFARTVELLNRGAIIAVKGLGGIHLAVRASMELQVRRLRKLREKPTKPLAIMSLDMASVREYAVVSQVAEQLLTSWRRPILVLPKREPFPLASSLAPDLDTIGVMLPYSGINRLLFDGLDDLALVMTSANPPGLPTEIHATTFQERFMQMADYLLTHNRTIYQRCDDSVVIPVNDHGLIVRRSRGYTPEPIETTYPGPPVLAVGAREKNTGAIYDGTRIFLTQHIGDIDGADTLGFLQSSLAHLQKLLRVKALSAIACDLHPDFLTTRLAEELANTNQVSLVRVQHHHAHLAALLADRRLPPNERIVAICTDGAGYGADQTIWGGEILAGDANGYERRAHLRAHPMPGGDLAAEYPLRMLIGILAEHYSTDELEQQLALVANKQLPRKEQELRIAVQQVAKRINAPLTSSTGRILDAVSALLGVCGHRLYEGEPAIKLEAYANNGHPNPAIRFSIPVTEDHDQLIIETGELLLQVWHQRHRFKGPDIALAVHEAVGKTLAQCATTIARQERIHKVGFTGGVAYNHILTQTILNVIKSNGLELLLHDYIPPGDAGTSAGQALVARAQLAE